MFMVTVFLGTFSVKLIFLACFGVISEFMLK